MSLNARKFRFETLLIHGGTDSGPAGATTVPIVQSSSFAHETADELEDVFRGRKPGQVYTRVGNPTTESLEKRLALLENGVAAVVTASGMAAITTAVMTIVRSGDEILSSSSLFGGTFSLFRDTMANFGITTRFVDPTDMVAIKSGINEKTRLVFVETIGNPKMDVPDIAAIAAVAREAGVPLMVDATVTTPYLAGGAELGADIVIHSTSKFINGTGSSIGGVIVDLGRFNWQSEKFPHFEPFVKKYRKPGIYRPGQEADSQGFRSMRCTNELVPHDRGHRDTCAQNGAALRKFPETGRFSPWSCKGKMGQLSGAD